MRVVLVTPTLGEHSSGNRTTVQRWRHHVGRKADLVLLGPHEAEHPTGPAPDLVHGYHALHGGEPARALAERLGVPLVVSLGGTDLFELRSGGERAGRVAAVLRAAKLATGAFDSFGSALANHCGIATPYRTVPRGVELPATTPACPRTGELRLLLPAGLRPVKGPLLALELVERLAGRGVPVRLRILGPERDEEYAARVRERAARLEGLVELGECAPEEMPQVYARTDIVWNTSLHEGGSNAILEAVACGCAVLARNVAGNRELLAEPGATGTLFDPDDFASFEAFHRVHLAEDDAARAARLARGRAWLARLHDPRAEARALIEAWHAALSTRGGQASANAP